MDDKENKKTEGKEEEKTQEPAEKTTPDNVDEGDKPKAASVVDEANTAAERLENIHKKIKEENDRTEDLLAKTALGGRAEAGIQKPKPKELTDIEYAEAVDRGEIDPLKNDGFI